MLDCDALAPCALEQVITPDNADQVKARVVVEGANGPVTPAADDILESNDVLVLPDVLANAGGVVVSYFEWVQGLQEYFWKEDEVNRAPARHRHPRVRRDARDRRESQDVDADGRLRAGGAARRRGDRDARALSLARARHPLPRAGLLALRARPCAGRGAAGRARLSLRGGRHHGRPGAGGALPRVAAGGRGRRRACVRLLRRRGSVPSQARRRPASGSAAAKAAMSLGLTPDHPLGLPGDAPGVRAACPERAVSGDSPRTGSFAGASVTSAGACDNRSAVSEPSGTMLVMLQTPLPGGSPDA